MACYRSSHPLHSAPIQSDPPRLGGAADKILIILARRIKGTRTEGGTLKHAFSLFHEGKCHDHSHVHSLTCAGSLIPMCAHKGRLYFRDSLFPSLGSLEENLLRAYLAAAYFFCVTIIQICVHGSFFSVTLDSL